MGGGHTATRPGMWGAVEAWTPGGGCGERVSGVPPAGQGPRGQRWLHRGKVGSSAPRSASADCGGPPALLFPPRGRLQPRVSHSALSCAVCRKRPTQVKCSLRFSVQPSLVFTLHRVAAAF